MQYRNLSRAEILIEHLAQVDARLLRDVRLYLLRRYGLMPELFIQTHQDRPPLVVIVHDLTDRMEHVAALVIHVARALTVRIICADDGALVPNAPTAAYH